MASMSFSRKRLAYLLLVMFGVAATSALIAIIILYNTAFTLEMDRLREIAQSQARLIEAIARFDQKHTAPGDPEAAFNATLSQLRDANKRHEGISTAGEFTLAKLEGDRIVFLFEHEHHKHDHSGHEQLTMQDMYAEPIKMALQGKSGVMVGIDYRGKKVLAAYEPLDWSYATLGIVAKIDIVEIREPFVRAGFITGFCTLFIVLGGSILFRRISNPLLRHIEESEEKYRLQFENSSDATLVADLKTGILVSANLKTVELLGRPLSEIIGKHHTMFYPQDRIAEAEERLQPAARKKESIFLELEVQKPDGTRVPVDITTNFFELGGKMFVMGNLRDATERKRIELLVSRLGRLMDHASNEIFIFDATSHQFTQVNMAARENLGYTLDDLKTISLANIVIDCDEEKLKNNLKPLITGEKKFVDKSFTLSRVDGSTYSAEGRIQYSVEENPPVFVLIAQDITEHKKAEGKLKESELRYRSITQSSSTAIVTADSSGKIVNWNPGAERIFGYAEQEAIGKNLLELMPERYREAHDKGFSNARAEGKSKIAGVPVQLEGLRKSGDEFPLEMTLSSWETGDGLFFSGIIRDLTEKEAIKVQM